MFNFVIYRPIVKIEYCYGVIAISKFGFVTEKLRNERKCFYGVTGDE